MLWASIQAGDRKAFEAIYHRHVRRLHQEISKRISDQTAVEDLTQDIFLSLWEKRHTYQPHGAIYPYLFGMAVNRVLNYYRTHKLQPELLQVWENLPEDITGLQELSDPFRQAHNEEMESLLNGAIASLPNRMRQVYKLRYEDNRTVPDIASQLSTSPNTVYNQLKSIRKRFVDALKHTRFFFFL